MEKLLQIFTEAASDENLLIVIVNLAVALGLYGTNIFFGTIIGAKTDSFDLKKFLFGVLKALGSCLGIFVFCYLLNVFSIGMNMTDLISIKTEVISTIQVIGVLYVWVIDLAKEVMDKIKSFRNLKYVSYDDMDITQINDYDTDYSMKG